MLSNILLTVEDVRQLASECLLRNGCDEANAAAVADIITRAETDGCHSHGLMRLAGYVAALKSGKVDGTARPKIRNLAPAIIQVNGGGGFAPLALEQSRSHLVEAARSNGLAALALVNIHHFGALWCEVEPVVEAGLCAMACTSYKPAVLPAGGHEALYGTNPVAFGWPRPTAFPVIFDQASAVMARGEVMLAAREGHELPAGTGVDADGNPTTDPNKVLKGALLAFGGYKGASIAMMVELLAGGLIGESFSFEAAERDNGDGGPPQGGEFMFAIDPAMFGDADGWSDHSEKLFEKIEAQDGARLPGERRRRNREHSVANGVEISQTVMEQIKGL